MAMNPQDFFFFFFFEIKNEKTKIVVRKIGIRVRGKRNPIYIDINIEMFYVFE